MEAVIAFFFFFELYYILDFFYASDRFPIQTTAPPFLGLISWICALRIDAYKEMYSGRLPGDMTMI